MASAFALLLAGMACGTGPGRETDPARRHLDIVGGEPSTLDQDSVVLLVRGRYESFGTGVAVAPRLVMTARHFLYDAELGENRSILCADEGRGTPVIRAWDPTTIQVFMGSARPLSPITARGVNVYSGNTLDVCANDIAILEVDIDLPVAPMPLRLNQPPSIDEEATLVGWGATLADIAMPSFQHLTDARQQRDISVLALGPGVFTSSRGTAIPIQESAFLGTEGGCLGDSGAPLISKLTGAVIGIDSGEPNVDPTIGLNAEDERVQCLNALTMFKRLDLQQPWIRSAFRAVGAAPWFEGYAPPASFGNPCRDEHECVSGLCVVTDASSYCSQPCDDQSCPDGAECVGSAGARVCGISAIDAGTGGPRCAQAPVVPKGLPPGLGVALCLLAAARRRSRARNCRPSHQEATCNDPCSPASASSSPPSPSTAKIEHQRARFAAGSSQQPS